METQMLIRIVAGVLMIAVIGVFAAKRVLWLTKLIRSGQPMSESNNRKDHLQTRITTQIEEVFGQTRLLKWNPAGIAHFFTMWGFFILLTVYIEAFGLQVLRVRVAAATAGAAPDGHGLGCERRGGEGHESGQGETFHVMSFHVVGSAAHEAPPSWLRIKPSAVAAAIRDGSVG